MFSAAGVECGSRFGKGSSDGAPDTKNPIFAEAEDRAAARAAGGADAWHAPREDGQIPDIYIAMGQTAENVAQQRGISRAERTSFAAGRRTPCRTPSRSRSCISTDLHYAFLSD